ncbi:hypothetical protein K432DRAFT_444432 [Lepidopterella palustris CBS 459.81]|uniref:Uncharacterized protein n=1 Tax=Lepidopterella palustris CBS 459.81 TaxID=1314670 RepID=A0A8E2E7Q1_9PEZI|nr:hypothetical protein K432DRAFT_444432 [Lepidopterella palustris CBS 459.81]
MQSQNPPQAKLPRPAPRGRQPKAAAAATTADKSPKNKDAQDKAAKAFDRTTQRNNALHAEVERLRKILGSIGAMIYPDMVDPTPKVPIQVGGEREERGRGREFKGNYVEEVVEVASSSDRTRCASHPNLQQFGEPVIEPVSSESNAVTTNLPTSTVLGESMPDQINHSLCALPTISHHAEVVQQIANPTTENLHLFPSTSPDQDFSIDLSFQPHTTIPPLLSPLSHSPTCPSWLWQTTNLVLSRILEISPAQALEARHAEQGAIFKGISKGWKTLCHTTDKSRDSDSEGV